MAGESITESTREEIQGENFRKPSCYLRFTWGPSVLAERTGRPLPPLLRKAKVAHRPALHPRIRYASRIIRPGSAANRSASQPDVEVNYGMDKRPDDF